MEKSLTQATFSVKIQDIILDEFYLEEKLPVEVAKKLDKSKIQFEFNAGANIDITKKIVTIKLSTNFFAEEEKKNNIGHINTSGIFEISNIEEVLNVSEGKLANSVLSSFIGVTLSTTRGFLIMKSKNTFMEGVIMPMINPMNFFPTQIEAISKKD